MQVSRVLYLMYGFSFENNLSAGAELQGTDRYIYDFLHCLHLPTHLAFVLGSVGSSKNSL